jgi:uncharacterized protein YjbJ (UPF0337 family)
MADLKTEGMFQKLRGKVRTVWGDITDDDMDRAGGSFDKLIGTIKEKTGETEDAIRRRLERLGDDDESDVRTEQRTMR